MSDLDSYILSHIDAEGEYLHRLWRDTQLKLSYGQMASGHLQGRLLKMLVQMIRPQRVLELGMFSGYSALSMAEGLEEGAELHTFEVFDEMEDFARPWIEGSPYGHFVHIHIGDAKALVPQMEVEWDMAFIDADKREYVEYYEMICRVCAGVATFWQTIPFGTDVSRNRRAKATSRPLGCRGSTTLWRQTTEWRRSSCPSGTA